MKKKYEDEIGKLLRKKAEFAQDDDYSKYLNFAHHFIKNIDKYHSQADLEIKQLMVSSIFPEKLTYVKNKYL